MKVQEYMRIWVLWYYGNGAYPDVLHFGLTYEELVHVKQKEDEITKILGSPDH